MRVLDSNAFNETLAKLLSKLSDEVSNISPENVHYFPVELLDKARSYVDREYMFDDGAWVNNVDGYKLKGVASFLKSNFYEYLFVSESYDVFSARANMKELTAEASYLVPSGWDGRNGFFVMDANILKRMTKTRTVGASGFKGNITQNKSTIEVEIYQPDSNGSDIPEYLQLIGVLWREKNA